MKQQQQQQQELAKKTFSPQITKLKREKNYTTIQR